jgi:Flp pilus assembly CpaE family ATPase
VKDIHTAQKMLAALTERGVPLGNVLPLANRCYRRRAILSLEDAKRALGGIHVERIRNDFKSAIQALNYGRSLAQAAPRSILQRDIRDLATKIFESAQSDSRASS